MKKKLLNVKKLRVKVTDIKPRKHAKGGFYGTGVYSHTRDLRASGI
jgi:hypothetical protein